MPIRIDLRGSCHERLKMSVNHCGVAMRRRIYDISARQIGRAWISAEAGLFCTSVTASKADPAGKAELD